MSSSITVYAVSLDRLRQLIGSRDQSFVDEVHRSMKRFLSRVDEIDDEAELKCGEAVAELIHDRLSDGPGYLYGYALKAICATAGTELPNIPQITDATGWIDEIDKLLTRLDVPLRMKSLVFRGSPVPIPEPDDYPCLGFWTEAEIAAALPALRALNPDDAGEESDTLIQIREWIAKTASTHHAIVGFLS